MKASRQTKSPRNRTTKTTSAAAKKNVFGKGLSPSKRHREKLNSVMSELCELLPLPEDVKSSLDRLSILKLTVSFFNTQNLMITDATPKTCKQPRTSEEKSAVTVEGIDLSEITLKAIGGFFIVMTEDGIVYYVSENVKSYLGYPQTRLMHQDFFPLVCSSDLYGLKSCFKTFMTPSCETKNSDLLTGGRKECFCNIKCHAGRLSSHVSPFYYKCFKFYGRVKTVTNRSTSEIKQGFFALCSPVTRQVDVCRPLSNNIEKYTCKMNAAMSNLDVDTRGLKLLSFSENDLAGRTAYCFFHPDDLYGMSLAHEFLLLGVELCMTFRVLKGNGKWQWVRGHAYSLFKDGRLDGMVSKNFLISDEEGEYFKIQDVQDLQERKSKRSLPSSRSNSSSSLSSNSSLHTSEGQSSAGSLPNSGNMSPNIKDMSLHSLQTTPFPELLSLEGNSSSVTSSISTQDMPSLSTLPNKKVKSYCRVNEETPTFKNLPDFDSDTMLRIIQDLQQTLIDNTNGKLPANFQGKYSGSFENGDTNHQGHFQERVGGYFSEKVGDHFQEKFDGHLDPEMMTTQAIDEMEQHVLDNGLGFLDISPDNPSTATKPYNESCSDMTKRHDVIHGVPEPLYRIPENVNNVNSLQSFKNKFFFPPSQDDGIANACRLKTLYKNSLTDFVPLPLVEVEKTLSNEENSFSVTSTTTSSTFDLPSHPIQIGMSPLHQQTNRFHGNSQMQCFDGNYNVGSAVPCKGLTSSNTVTVETDVTTYSGFPGSFTYNVHSS